MLPGALIGQKLLHYEISIQLGEGGMGVVYQATDTRLNREVAIKVLPPAFVEDEERLARFQREAQLLASLNHPNIGSIFGLEEEAAQRFLVLELVPGETLAERLSHGAMPVNEAVAAGIQIARALEAAHERGIGRLQRLGDLQRDSRCPLEGHRALSDVLRQVCSVGQLHDQKLLIVSLLQTVDGGDVGMAQARQHPRLALESGKPLRILGHLFGQHLDRHLPAELRILSAVDLSHAALTELGGDLEVREGLADQIRVILPRERKRCA